MADISGLTRTGTLVGDLTFRKFDRGDGTIEDICIFTMESQIDLGGNDVVKDRTKVLATKSALEYLRTEAPKKGTSLLISGALSYVKEESLCCRITSKEQIAVLTKTANRGTERHIEYITAEEFFGGLPKFNGQHHEKGE